ncbi:MAG: hypothetical protein Barrevirus12_18 [Barrevirus sp.]|uniref:Uncharacterized protein n=1 Tax=Barrevirus sp. TaxID=2487763 RepID=A0A3G4ZUL1_9VIRU|nr:MAG: hypothetical protein Barrevirus12_18 [Barrevirus sp.]
MSSNSTHSSRSSRSSRSSISAHSHHSHISHRSHKSHKSGRSSISSISSVSHKSHRSSISARSSKSSQSSRSSRSNTCRRIRTNIARGVDVRAYGDVSVGPNSPNFFVATLFGKKAKKVGQTRKYNVTNPSNFGQQFKLHNGSLTVTFPNNSEVLYTSPINANVVASFPQLANQVNNPNAQLYTYVGNHYKKDNSNLKWVTKGSLKCVDYIETRAVFLVMVNGSSVTFQEALGANWFLGSKRNGEPIKNDKNKK